MQDTGIKESLRCYAKLLKLPTFSDLSEEKAKYKAGESLEEFVLCLMKKEYDARQEKQRQRRIKRAHFPILKTLEEFDLSQLEHVKPEYVKQLASCDFIRRHENLIMIGNPGTGKTHLAIAIGVKACQMGLKTKFFSVTELVLKLAEARKQGTLEKLVKDLQKQDLLILDEWGYVPVDRDGSQMLFRIVSDSYERKSLILTTNLEFSKWNRRL